MKNLNVLEERLLNKPTEIVEEIKNSFKCTRRPHSRYTEMEVEYEGYYWIGYFIKNNKVEETKKRITLKILETLAEEYTIGYWNIEELYK